MEQSEALTESTVPVEIIYKSVDNDIEKLKPSLLKTEDHYTKESNGSCKLYMICTAFIANLVIFASGIGLSWTSPVIPILHTMEPDNPLGRTITTTEEAWIAALLQLGAAIGPLAAGVSADRIGRKKTLLFLALPMLLGYIMLACAHSVITFYIARFLKGLGLGSAFAILPIYLGEITESHNRGKHGCIMGVFITIGLFYPFAIGPHLPLTIYTMTCTIPLFLFLTCFSLFMPETPYYLAAINDKTGAEKVLRKLRNTAHVQNELSEIIKCVEMEENNKGGINDMFATPAARKSVIISFGLVLLQQFAGINPVLAYLKTIFQATGSTISPNVSTAIIGVVEVTSNSAVAFLVERLGRRILLLASCLVCFLSIFLLGLYFFLMNYGIDVTQIFWLPVFCMIIYNMFFSIGLGPLPWTVMGEIFPSNIKGIASACSSSISFFAACGITFLFPIISETLTMAGSFWLYGGFCILGWVFIYYVVPETKGKTLTEIQENLSRI